MSGHDTNSQNQTSRFLTLYYLAIDYADNKTKVLNHSVPFPSQIGFYPFSFLDTTNVYNNTFRSAPRVTQGGGMESAAQDRHQRLSRQHCRRGSQQVDFGDADQHPGCELHALRAVTC